MLLLDRALPNLLLLSPGLPPAKTLPGRESRAAIPSQDVDWRIANARDPRPRRIESRIDPAIYDGAQ